MVPLKAFHCIRLCLRVNKVKPVPWKSEFEKNVSALDALSPLKLLNSGYSVVEKNGKSVKSIKMLKTDDEIDLILSDGKLRGKII